MATSRKTIARLLLGGVGIALVLVLLAGFALPRFVDTAPYKAMIVSQIAARVGGEVTLRALRLSLWPLPHAVLEGLHISVRNGIDGSVASVSVYPRLRSLLTGTLRPASVRINRPNITVPAPHSAGAQATVGAESVAGMQDAFAAALSALSSGAAAEAPGLVVIASHGTVEVSRPSAPALSFTNIHARVQLPPGQVALDLTCGSNLWERLSLSAALDPITTTGTGRLDVVRLHPHRLFDGVSAEDGLTLEDADLNLAAQLQFGGAHALAVDFDGSVPVVAVRRGTQRLTITGDALTGTLHIDDSATTLTVSELHLQSPAVRLSGTFSTAPAAARTNLEVNARDVDVASVRQATTVIAGAEPVSAKIFDVVRGGTVPQVTVRSTGRSLSDLGSSDAFTVQGQLRNGRIHVPGVDLDFDDVDGAAMVSRGILTGEQITARLGKSRVSAGTLHLGLEGDAPELHVTATAQADAAELQLLLKRLVTQARVVNLMDRIAALQGSLTGELTIDGTTKNLNVAADVSHLDVSGQVKDLVRPLQVTGGRVVYSAGRVTATNMHIAMSESDLTATGDLMWSPDELHVQRLHLHDAHADASGALRWAPEVLDLQFQGSLDKQTVDLLVPDNTVLQGSVRGDFQARVPLNEPESSTARGTLEADGVVLSSAPDTPLRVDRVALHAGGRKVRVDAALDAGRDGIVQIRGSVRSGPHALMIDCDTTAGRLNWSRLERQLALGASADAAPTVSAWRVPVHGMVRVAAESFTYDRFTWKPVRATVTLRPSGPHVTVTEATVCGIATPGQVAVTAEGIELGFTPVARDQPLNAMLACLANRPGLATGTYSLVAEVESRGEPAALLSALQGHVEVTANNGQIARMGLLAKVFSTLSIVTGSLGNLPDLTKDTLPYDSISVKGDLHGTTLRLDEAGLEGPSVKMAAQGSADVHHQTVELTLLVAPLRTVDTVVSHIPIVSGVLGGSLVSIPVRVSGPLDDPEVIPLSPSAVGKELLGFMGRTMKLPWHLIQPLLPNTEKPK